MSSIHHPVLARLGMRAAEEQERVLRDDDADTDVLLAGVHRRQAARRTRLRRMAFAVVASSLVLVLVAFFGFRRSNVAMPVAVAPAPGVRSAETTEVPLAFPDGSNVVVKPGTTADLREVGPHHALIALDRGTVDVHVVHTDDTRWDVVAGPFDVRVTGTRFDAAWDPTDKRLTVAMKEGSVHVTGPCVNERLAAPSTKTFACDAPNPNPGATNVAAPPTVAPSDLPSSIPVTTAKQDDSAAAMLARADEARLVGDAARAQRLYVSLRERHPKSAEAAKAAFLLGRLAESSGSMDDAARWYATVTRESPHSGYAQDALGRALELAQRRGDQEGARRLADEYLKKHPNGPHRAYATSILEQGTPRTP